MSSTSDSPSSSRASVLRELLAPSDLAAAVRELGVEPRRCLICEGTWLERLFRRSEKWFWHCRTCHLVFVHDIYPEFVHDTETVERTYVFEEIQDPGPRKLRKYDEFLAPLEPWRTVPGGGRLAEVGCGQGLFLARARERGWTVSGVEILPEMAENARRRGLDVFLGQLHEAAHPDASFDAVVMREVIEHIVDPVALLREVHRVLRPGGVVVMGTGNARSWSARWRGARWHYYRFGGHMHIRFYSPASAEALARAAGFERAESRTRGFAFLEAGEARGHWYRPLLRLAQVPISPLATALGAGHRLVMTFHKGA